LGLCPEGSEGTTYALLTTFSNLAGTIAFDISTILADLPRFDVSSATLAAGDFSGVLSLTIIAALVSPLPLIFLYLIPEGKEEQKILQQDTRKFFWCGVIFVLVMTITLLLTFSESVYTIFVEGKLN
jgi:hypothetical protein